MRRVRQGLAVGIVMSALLVTACGSDSDGTDSKTIEPATAASAPSLAGPASGEVRPAEPVRAMVADEQTGSAVALIGDGTRLAVFDLGSAAPARVIDLRATGDTVASGRPGEVLVPAGNRVLRVDIRTSAITPVAVDGDARSATLLSDGRLAVGTARGSTTVFADGRPVQTVSGLASVDALAATGNSLSALDRRQTSLTEYDLGDGSIGLALRAGEGATNLTTDRFGRILVTDTGGNELLVFGADPLVMRQRYPVPNAPYGIAYDERADIAWVTLTGSNEVVGYDLSSGMPEQVARFGTVRQPNSVAVDARSGDLLIGSATGDGLQRIVGAGGSRPTTSAAPR